MAERLFFMPFLSVGYDEISIPIFVVIPCKRHNFDINLKNL